MPCFLGPHTYSGSLMLTLLTFWINPFIFPANHIISPLVDWAINKAGQSCLPLMAAILANDLSDFV